MPKKDHKVVVQNIETREIGENFLGGVYPREVPPQKKGDDKLGDK